ncbi:hypothetical protein GCM10009837_56810 [Streptomyces durmitorensis]|uniref:Uncharacterized protein n=1 Tax=Streptomyces durmitorensis TaxID=319947 RepID=A0ABY4PTT5_9ACTN|nr:hypothetical protein [Streptomyces durmitorensis]UQT56334.1 hypothetical protein M4V62_15185 [Streptomyces durmitorensis]
MSPRTARTQRPSRSETRAEGNKAVAVGRVLGDFVISLVLGDGLKNAVGDASTWRVWNWPPFLIVLGLGTTALVIAPGGPQSQYAGVYVLLGLALLLAGARIVGIVAPSATKALVSALSVLLAVGALLWVDRLTEHGEVDVTGRAEISRGPVENGDLLSVVVADAPSRTHLRLALMVRDAVPDAQSCTPETRLTVALRGAGANSAHTDVRAGQAVDLPLGGAHGALRVDVTVHTDPGCRMTVSVDDAVLHG